MINFYVKLQVELGSKKNESDILFLKTSNRIELA